MDRDVQELRRMFGLWDSRTALLSTTPHTDRVRQDMQVDYITIIESYDGILCPRIGLGIESDGENIRHFVTPVFETPEELEMFCCQHRNELVIR